MRILRPSISKGFSRNLHHLCLDRTPSTSAKHDELAKSLALRLFDSSLHLPASYLPCRRVHAGLPHNEDNERGSKKATRVAFARP